MHPSKYNMSSVQTNSTLNYHTILVKSATRGSSVLDLVFTSEPDMADNVSVLGPLGSSDHSMLHWTVRLNAVGSKSN